MFRLVVALYLMIVTAVGPAACCCTFSRLTARSADKPSTPAPRPAPASCCCHGSEQPAPADAPKRPRPPERRDSPGCPCKQAVGCEVVGLPATHDEVLETSVRAFG